MAWSTFFFVEAIVETEWASTRRDTRLLRARAVDISITGGVFTSKLKCTTAACSQHVPRTGKVYAGMCGIA